MFINRVYPPARGASGRMLRDLARGFARDGWTVTVVTTGPATRLEKDGPVKVFRHKAFLRGKSALSYLGVWLKLYGASLAQPRHDLVVSMTDPPMLALVGDFIARGKKSKHIHWCQDLYPDVLPALGFNVPEWALGLLKRVMRKVLKRTDRIVAVGRCMARHLTRTGLDPRRITVIPNWPDRELLVGARRQPRHEGGWKTVFRAATDGIVMDEAQRSKIYDALFRDEYPKFRVLYSGNLGRAHPVQPILDAAQILNRTNPEIEFVFVGDGPSFDRLAAERTRRGLENVRLLPYQPVSRLRELMESGDVHLITMHEDAAGLIVPCKLYSALAVARPCILVGPSHAETAIVINDFNAGTVISQGEPRLLAQTILNYRANPDMWFMAHEGAARAGRIFLPQESIYAWVKRARDLIQVRPPAARRYKSAIGAAAERKAA